MSTVTSTFPATHNSLLRLSVIAGLIAGVADVIIYHWFVVNVRGGISLISVYQSIASGALGESAFAGGLATALLAVILKFVMTISSIIPGSLLYGIGVFVVMNFIVLPLSASAARATHHEIPVQIPRQFLHKYGHNGSRTDGMNSTKRV